MLGANIKGQGQFRNFRGMDNLVILFICQLRLRCKYEINESFKVYAEFYLVLVVIRSFRSYAEFWEPTS